MLTQAGDNDKDINGVRVYDYKKEDNIAICYVVHVS